MNKTSIEWVKNPDGTQGYTWNPITGCLNGCEYCYARKLANTRLRERYLANKNTAPAEGNILLPNLGFVEMNPFYPRFWEDRLDIRRHYLPDDCRNHTKPRGIFVCDMSDLFGIGVPEEWTLRVKNFITEASGHSSHRFYLLTKQPQNLIKFNPFPPNCWVGVTVTDASSMSKAGFALLEIEAKVKYLSIEPFLNSFYPSPLSLKSVADWVIIGACTGTMVEMAWLGGRYPDLDLMPYGNKWILQPKIEWVQEIVSACDKAGVKVFLKDNLKPMLRSVDYVLPTNIAMGAWLRQELPK